MRNDFEKIQKGQREKGNIYFGGMAGDRKTCRCFVNENRNLHKTNICKRANHLLHNKKCCSDNERLAYHWEQHQSKYVVFSLSL